ncbi:MAG: hypothetical protein ACTSPB_02970 [Candidatus Thorarchaeota archaeon]
MMQEVLPNQINKVSLPLISRTTGIKITSGTINFYLVRLDTEQWYNGVTGLWSVTEVIAGVGIHRARGHWYTELAATAWLLNTRYEVYAEESQDLSVVVGEEVQCRIIPVGYGATQVNYYVFTNETLESGPLAECKVWVTTDIAGLYIVASGYTDTLGKVTFYLDAGTYYMWRKKAGYVFTNPDTEIVT